VHYAAVVVAVLRLSTHSFRSVFGTPSAGNRKPKLDGIITTHITWNGSIRLSVRARPSNAYGISVPSEKLCDRVKRLYRCKSMRYDSFSTFARYPMNSCRAVSVLRHFENPPWRFRVPNHPLEQRFSTTNDAQSSKVVRERNIPLCIKKKKKFYYIWLILPEKSSHNFVTKNVKTTVNGWHISPFKRSTYEPARPEPIDILC
jgi:hypothetical protein